ncbi:MAG: GIY-YIG nuclease family protein [Anaerolineae bacterium]|nr:GIY-YIG nuclease family protein [Anaerolineae bacterium]
MQSAPNPSPTPGDIRLPAVPGTYVLFVWLNDPAQLAVGRLGTVSLAQGLYAYVGSARGPGGLHARVGRHLRADKTPRWHIDTLTTLAPVITIWFSTSPERLECAWAHTLMATPGITMPIPGFGSSDCNCPAHLFAVPLKALCQAWTMLKQPTWIDLL